MKNIIIFIFSTLWIFNFSQVFASDNLNNLDIQQTVYVLNNLSIYSETSTSSLYSSTGYIAERKNEPLKYNISSDWILSLPTYQVTRKNLFTILNKEKSYLKNIWNNNTDDISPYIDPDACDIWLNDIKDVYNSSESSSIPSYKNFNQKGLNRLVWCYMFLNKKFTYSEINTEKANYRVTNIWLGLDTLYNTIWYPWDIYSIYDHISNNDSNYVDGYALQLVGDQVEAFKASWGGLCGVSTVFYQAALKTYGLSYVERSPHLDYYVSYYGWILWLDATIFWSWKTAYKDLKFRNDTDQNFLIKTADWTSWNRFIYGVYFYHPFIETRDTTEYKRDGNCITNYIKSKDWTDEITSCYHTIHK